MFILVIQQPCMKRGLMIQCKIVMLISLILAATNSKAHISLVVWEKSEKSENFRFTKLSVIPLFTYWNSVNTCESNCLCWK